MFEIGRKRVGAGQPAFIICEAGSNHDCKLPQAKKLIQAAAAAGADAVKFQLFNADVLYAKDHPAHAAVRKVELDRSWLPELADYSAERGILFMASPFDAEAVDQLEKVGVLAYKVGSSETTNLKLLRKMAATNKPIILSTGMCDMADVAEAVEAVKSTGNSKIVLLQCSAVYPAEPEQVHLRVMETLKSAFQLPIGFSDHSLGINIPLAAAALGACVIEKHMTLDRTLPGPDHSYAIEPDEFKRMVQGIRAVENALGSPAKVMLKEEAMYARRDSVHAARDIRAGEALTRENLALHRPGLGIRPRYFETLLGSSAARSIKKGEPVTWDLVVIPAKAGIQVADLV
jgi:N-acetylneuraminate synthase/N,N'-diacetyllegionaminate synthase